MTIQIRYNDIKGVVKMHYQVRPARMADLERIEAIYAYARKFMAEHGNPDQWGNSYPLRQWLEMDIAENALFVIEGPVEIHGVFYFTIGEDPTYGEIFNGAWKSHSPYGTIHRIAGDGSGGILKTAVVFCREQIDHIRIDTHKDNTVMQSALDKQDFQYCGIIYVEDGTPRLAYEWLKK